MKRRNRIILLLGLAIVLLFLAGRESYQFFHNIRRLSPPTQETREPFGPNIHGWMKVEEVAEFYHVSPAEVFAALDISPAPGDEKLTLKDLSEKYNKTCPEIEDGLSQFSRPDDPSRGREYNG